MSDININIRLMSKAAEASLGSFGAAAKKAQQRLTLFEKATRQVNRSIDSFVGNLGANLAFRAFNGVIRGISAMVSNVRAFETALVGVGKTTGLAGDELQALGKRVEDLSKEIPVATTELLGLAQTAAQLGVKGSDNILKFTETMARLAVATDIVGEQGAIAFARIINVTGENVQSVDKLGSAIVALGNNFAATESQILTVSNEVAKGGARFGLTAQEVLGLSTAMASLGVKAQVAGSTTQKVFTQVEKAIGLGGDELAKFTKILGLSEDGFTDLFETDPQKFFVELVKGLKRSETGGKKLTTTLAELGFADIRVGKTLGPLIERTDELTRAVDLSSEAYTINQALLDESEAAFQTLDADLQKLENTFFALSNSILNNLVPALSATVKGFTSIFDLLSENADVIITFAALSTAALITFQVNIAIAATNLGILEFAMLAAGAAADFMWASINLPLVGVLAGIALLTGAIVIIARNWDAVSLSVLKVVSATTKFLGIAIPGLDDELERLKKKEKFNKEIVKAKEAELRLEKEIQTATGVDQAKAEQRSIRQGGNNEISSTKQDTEEDIEKRRKAAIRARQLQELEDLRNFGEQKNALILEQKRAQFIADDEQGVERDEFVLEAEADKLALELEMKKERLAQLLGLEDDANKLAISKQKKQNDLEINEAKRANDAKLKLTKTLETQKANIQQAGFGLAAAVAKDGSKVQFLIQKAAAVAQLSLARGQALGAIPAQTAVLPAPAVPPAVTALTANANTSFAIGLATVIASTIKGFQDGGVVGGSSFRGDNVLARVNSGEMILNRDQQTQLFKQANGGGSDRVIEVTSIVQIDETEIGRAVSREVANGLSLGEGGV